MNKSRQDSKDRSKPIRDALKRAAGDDEPNIGPLLAKLPDLMNEVRRRRTAEPIGVETRIPIDPGPTLAAGAWRALPRLAILTAITAALALLVLLRERTAETPPSNIDAVILGGANSAAHEDVLLEAVLGGERTDG